MSVKASVFFAAVATVLAFAANAALAAMKVTSSNAPAHKVGDVIDGKTKLNLPAGGIVKGADPDTNATATFIGPYKGTVSNYKAPKNERSNVGVGGSVGGTMGAAPKH